MVGGWGGQRGVQRHVAGDMCGAKMTSPVLNQIPLILLRPCWLGGFISEGNWKRPSHKWHLALPCGVVSVTSSASLAVRTPSFDYHYFFKCLKCRGGARCHPRHLGELHFSLQKNKRRMKNSPRCVCKSVANGTQLKGGGRGVWVGSLDFNEEGKGGIGKKSQREQKNIHRSADDRPSWACHHTPTRGRCSQEDTQWSPPAAVMLDHLHTCVFLMSCNEEGKGGVGIKTQEFIYSFDF